MFSVLYIFLQNICIQVRNTSVHSAHQNIYQIMHIFLASYPLTLLDSMILITFFKIILFGILPLLMVVLVLPSFSHIINLVFKQEILMQRVIFQGPMDIEVSVP